jgi:hypothetical protein
MNLTTLEMTTEEATRRLAEYSEQLAAERTVEDEAILAGYRAAARGLPVVMLTEVFNAGGWFDNGLPRLAIARADATEVRVEVERPWSTNETVDLVFLDEERAENRGALIGKHSVRVNRVVGRPTPGGQMRTRAGTIVPLIPPRLRPRKHRIRGFHILWEVDSWTPLPSKDPALLRHIRGDLWSVVATWDLTELEMAVLSQRAR